MRLAASVTLITRVPTSIATSYRPPAAYDQEASRAHCHCRVDEIDFQSCRFHATLIDA
jgi:hypothetical protein